MNSELMERVRRYRVSETVFKRMLAEGIITGEEKVEIDTILLERYGLSSCSIFT